LTTCTPTFGTEFDENEPPSIDSNVRSIENDSQKEIKELRALFNTNKYTDLIDLSCRARDNSVTEHVKK